VFYSYRLGTSEHDKKEGVKRHMWTPHLKKWGVSCPGTPWTSWLRAPVSMVNYLSQKLVASTYIYTYYYVRHAGGQFTGKIYTVNQFIETADRKK